MFYKKISNTRIELIVAFITIYFFYSCKTPWEVRETQTHKIALNDDFKPLPTVEKFIEPYRTHINKEMDSVLAFAPETLEKSKGKWQSNIGNFMADVCKEYGNRIFYERYQKKIDLCLLNHGGIRSIIPSGNVTTRTAFEVMPFENSLVVLSLSGKEINEMIDLFLKDKKPHPTSGIQLKINKENQLIEAKINYQNIDVNKLYYVATSDYLAFGGDNMTFFLKAKQTYDLNYKIRNILIDHFKNNDTIKAHMDQRIIME